MWRTGLWTSSQVRVTDGVVERAGLSGVEEERIARETVAFLIESRPGTDIPAVIDLDDLAETYGDAYLKELGRRLSSW
ncbi:hypothetical protein [Streptomyces sp. NBC_01092]|uniref:hypothetical protein n=1 Tax=Streptomyces sp. NBC_01092 TaxID=2903748 RepID=UPI0038705588|nr:hypothetical protein OG254_39115 [Streptomyces sp. NBC_01092]